MISRLAPIRQVGFMGMLDGTARPMTPPTVGAALPNRHHRFSSHYGADYGVVVTVPPAPALATSAHDHRRVPATIDSSAGASTDRCADLSGVVQPMIRHIGAVQRSAHNPACRTTLKVAPRLRTCCDL
jgi:hypothetical protein